MEIMVQSKESCEIKQFFSEREHFLKNFIKRTGTDTLKSRNFVALLSKQEICINVCQLLARTISFFLKVGH